MKKHYETHVEDTDATSTEFNSLITSDEWSTNTKDYDI